MRLSLGPSVTVAAAVLGGLAAAVFWTPDPPVPAVLVESHRRTSVSASDADQGGLVVDLPPGTRCTLLGPVTTSSVLVDVSGRRYWVDASNVRSLVERGDHPPGAVPARE